jgi:hypothetical protein
VGVLQRVGGDRVHLVGTAHLDDELPLVHIRAIFAEVGQTNAFGRVVLVKEDHLGGGLAILAHHVAVVVVLYVIVVGVDLQRGDGLQVLRLFALVGDTGAQRSADVENIRVVGFDLHSRSTSRQGQRNRGNAPTVRAVSYLCSAGKVAVYHGIHRLLPCPV